MSDNQLIVPIATPSGSLHFATIHPEGTVDDALQILLTDDEATSDVLGDLESYGWALQRMRKERNGRQWEEDELERLGNGVYVFMTRGRPMFILHPPGILMGSLPVSPLMNTTNTPSEAQRHFSAFPLTSHLHTPTLRLISLHPFLSLTVSFLRVPEIHDDFQWKIFIGRQTTAQNAIDQAVEELGLTKTLPVPGGGPIDYVLEEIWSDGHSESESAPMILKCIPEAQVTHRIHSRSF